MIDNRYVQLEYLESSGTQYIDTGIKAIANSKVEMKFNRTAYAGETNVSAVFGGYDSNQRNYGLAIDTTTIYWMFGGQSNAKKTFPLDTDYEVVFDGANKTFTIGDFTQSFSSLSLTAKSNGNIYLFTNSAVGSLSTYDKHYWLKGKIYYFKYYENGTLVRHLVPAKRKSDNVLGMFDKVNNVFYTNKGTGSFIGGKEIKDTFKSRIVPHAYRQLSYLESTGTQYIDTGYKLNNNSILEIEAQSTDATQSNNTLAGVGETGASSDRVQFHFGSAAGTVSMRIDGTLSANQTVGTNKFKGIIDIPNKKAYFNGTQIISSFSGDINTSVNFPLFRRSCVESTGVIYSKARIYSFTIKENNALIRNFIPVVRKLDNVAGMYDLVEGKFYTNAGTGAFIAGDIIKTVDKVRLDKYEFYDYIQTSKKEYIDAGLEFDPSKNTTISIDLEFTGLGTSISAMYIFGNTETSNKLAVNTYVSGAIYTYCGSSSGKSTAIIPQLNKKYNIKVVTTPTRYDYYLDEQVINTYTTGLPTTKIGMPLIFGNYWRGGTAVDDSRAFMGRFRGIKIIEDEVLVRDFVPAKRKSDGAIGMYDVVNDKLYTNAGTGEFTLGNKISSYNKEFAEQYQVLDYIQSSGTQYIDSGYKPIPATTRFEIAFTPNITNAAVFPFGARPDTAGASIYTCTSYINNTRMRLDWAGSSNSFSTLLNTTDKFVYKAYGNTVSLNDETFTGTNTRSTDRLAYNFGIFATNTGGTFDSRMLQAKVYSAKLWDNNVLVRDFIPVKRRSDNAVGMYDKVEKKFYGNLGTESFIAGNELSMPVKNEVNELRLPYNGNKYKFFDYIESSGTQWIDTGKKAPDNTDIEVRFSLTSMDDGASNNAAIFGGRNGTTSKTCTFFYLASVKPHYFRFDRQGQIQIANATQIRHQAGDIYKFSYHNNRSTEFINETTDESYTYTIAPLQTFTDHNISLFGVNTSGTVGTFMSGRIYGWKYWENGELLQDFLPAQRLSDNAIGMYDKITNTFFENKGTGVFVAGNEIVNIPNEYERLEYLQSSGTQYIDVDLSADSYGNNEMVVSLEYTDVTASQLFGANNGGYFGVRSGADYNVSSKTVAVNTPYTYDIKRSGGRYTRILNGTSYSTGSIQTRATTSVYLFAIAGFTSMSYTKCKVKHFEYYVDGILVRNLFPVRRKADNVLGMLDLVNNVFYTNAGTGSFTTGTKSMPNKVMMPFWKRYPDVPKEYEVKEYLESDGYAQIDSGIRFTQGDKIDMVGRFIDPQHDDGLICMTPWNQGNSSRFMFAVARQASGYSFCMSYNNLAGGNNRVTPYFTPDTEYHRWTYEDLTLTIDDGVSSLTNTDVYPDDSKINGSVYLFRRFNGGCKTAIKYYNHWRNGQLIASYVPVRRKSDGTLGMYDIATDKFLENVGTGSFTTNE